MGSFKNCDGQIELTDYLKSQITSGKVMDLTTWINSQGKAQYTQIGEVIEKAYEEYKDHCNPIDRITNVVSIWVLNQSMGYMKYLKDKSSV